MKRDPSLQGLSSEHHHALVLARGLEAGDVPDLYARFARELFRIEEEVLLPALAAVGARVLIARNLDEHAELCRLARDDPAAFGRRLREHVRFEEREPFPECRARLDASVVDAVAARRSKAR